jgi:LuxR family maltose regulon positive regulatory protein
MELLAQYVAPLHDPTYTAIARSCGTRLSIMQGMLKPAISWLRGSPPPVENMVWWLEIPSVTHCRALLAEGSEENIKKAEIKLQELLQLIQDNHNTCQMIQIMPVLAMVYGKEGHVDEALTILERAVDLASPGGWVRPFAELGPPMADLLKRLIKKNVAVAYIDRLLAAFRDDKQAMVPEASDAQAAPAPSLEPTFPRPPVSSPPPPLDEPLTNRELQILELLAQRLQNKEIAEDLFISVETVKAHLKSIYLKLDVSTRRQAIARAKALGIITGS